MPELQQLAQSLKHRLSLPLPGREAQLKMAHTERIINLSRYKIPEDAKHGAVLVLFYSEGYNIKFPLILRKSGDGVHAGQISLPGGKLEPGDEGLSETALRETEEEITAARERITLLGKLTELYIPPSNFLVQPFVGMLDEDPDFFPQAEEVVEVLTMSVDQLLNDSVAGIREITLSNGIRVNTPFYDLEGHVVWGATAMILSELKIILREIST
jgi:8-oxo-dGTP pyrophosphatase MutT (NUDIX family)